MKLPQLDPFNAFVYRGSLKSSNPLKPVLKNWKIAVKDNLAVKDWPLTCASRSLKDYIAPYTADIVETLMDLGAEIVGKANMDEFGMGSRGERSIFGASLNPLDVSKSAGGSSGGCSAAVSGGLCRLAIGSDTGGSVRLPASYTGTVGYKPTWGLLSRYGLVSYAPSLDTVGLMARSVEDVAICLEELFRTEERCKWKDPTLINLKPNELDMKESLPLEGVTIGIVEEWIQDLRGITGHPLDVILSELDKSGARFKLVNVPELNGEECLERYYEVACMEASSSLARYTGIFFENAKTDTGYEIRLNGSLSYNEKIQKYQDEFLGLEVQKRIERGRRLLSDSEGKYLKRTEGYRSSLKSSFEKLFKVECCDVLIGPTAFSTAPILSGGKVKSAEEKEDDLFTVPANLAGLPAISLPLHGISNGTDGVIGTQLMASHGDDRLLLRISREIESFYTKSIK